MEKSLTSTEQLDSILDEIWAWYISLPDIKQIRYQEDYEKLQRKIAAGWLIIDGELE